MHKSLKLIVAAAAICSTTGVAHAFSSSLADLISNRGTLTEGDKLFADFNLLSRTGDILPSGITVTASSNFDTYFLSFQGNMASGFGGEVDFSLYYSVATISGQPLISMIDQSFNLSVYTTGTGFGALVVIGEKVFDGPGIGANLVAQSKVGWVSADLPDLEDPPGEFATTGDDLDITPAKAKIWVATDVFLSANPDTTVAAPMIRQSFHQKTQVPDRGMTALMLGGALGSLGLLRRGIGA